MIFNEEKTKEAVVVGDVKSNNVSIDSANINFIVTILSTNLYSNPVSSFIRETVSNAWDSHKEAGVSDPVILDFITDTENRTFCTVKDFGMGLSPERFDKIYRNIGSSTKRGTDDQIGGFGIGRFSALAYSDMVNITSYYDKKEYSYVMYKDGNALSIDLLNTKDTNRRNGVEVSLEVQPNDFPKFKSAVTEQLAYFENLYIEMDPSTIDKFGDSLKSRYNNFKVKKFNNFYANTLEKHAGVSLLLGKVKYPLRSSNLDKTYIRKILSYPISLSFDIGELEITPNREEVLYSASNKKKIQDKLDAAILEIASLIKTIKTEDFTDLKDYEEAFDTPSKYYLIGDSTATESVAIPLVEKTQISFRGEIYDDPESFIAMSQILFNAYVFTVTHKVTNGKIRYSPRTLNLKFLKEGFSSMYIGKPQELKSMAKRYFRETTDEAAYFLKEFNYRKMYKTCLNDLNTRIEGNYSFRSYQQRTLRKIDKKGLKVLVGMIVKNLNKIPRVTDDSIPKSWIKKTKEEDARRRKLNKKLGFDWTQNINIYTYRHAQSSSDLPTVSKSYPLKGLNSRMHKLTVHGDKDDKKVEDFYRYLYKSPKSPKFVTIARTKRKLLKEIENFERIENFMDVKYSIIRNIGTARLIEKLIPNINNLKGIRNVEAISEKLAKAVNTISEFHNRYRDRSLVERTKKLGDEIYELCEEKNMFNVEIKSLVETNLTEINNLEVITPFLDNYGEIPNDRVNLLVDYVKARKLIRPSVKAVLRLKKETIFNIKEEENETN